MRFLRGWQHLKEVHCPDGERLLERRPSLKTSAFGANQQELFGKAVRVTRSGGTVLFFSYSDRFWEELLKWFEIQAEHGLIGGIDYGSTGNGIIVLQGRLSRHNKGRRRFRSRPRFSALYPNIIEMNS